ncbi:hypothetical protein J5U46_03440 [Micromonospora tulbaghiae]|nr:hypothetical protein [Micromonospora tulbaghiae]MBO4139210.1 hypothetical protein [Micromonospora tulbaghiae]MDX5456372.1 hypothetical protein [Micromonospora tulbaghiae]
MTPYWPAEEDWAGFLVVIVPVGPLPLPADELCRQVQAQIDADPVLYDLVTVRLAPRFKLTPEWDRAFVRTVVEAAMPAGHFFAPRGVIGLVVVSDDREKLRNVFDSLRDLPPSRRLWARIFGTGVRDSRNGSSPTAAGRVASTVNTLIEMYDEQPQIALNESTFLDRVGALIEEGYLTPSALGPEPSPASASAAGPASARERPGPVVESPRATASVPVVERRPSVVPAPDPVPADVRTPAARNAGAAKKPMLEAVMYDGSEIVAVDQRTPIQRLTGRQQTDAACMDELHRGGTAVGLVHLVFVPDDGVVPRRVTKRRNEVALELDQLLDSVELDVASGQPSRIAVEVLSATNPLQKHGVLRVAGTITEVALPKVKIEYFSMADIVEPLLDAAGRTSRALHARGVQVVSQHFVFLAAMRFPADEATEDDWVRLLDHGRVTWVDFSPTGGRQALHPMPPSPFGLHVLTDKEDVLAVIKEQSGVMYRYAQRLPTQAAPRDTSERDGHEPIASTASGRRWWRFGKRPGE